LRIERGGLKQVLLDVLLWRVEVRREGEEEEDVTQLIVSSGLTAEAFALFAVLFEL